MWGWGLGGLCLCGFLRAAPGRECRGRNCHKAQGGLGRALGLLLCQPCPGAPALPWALPGRGDAALLFLPAGEGVRPLQPPLPSQLRPGNSHFGSRICARSLSSVLSPQHRTQNAFSCLLPGLLPRLSQDLSEVTRSNLVGIAVMEDASAALSPAWFAGVPISCSGLSSPVLLCKEPGCAQPGRWDREGEPKFTFVHTCLTGYD